MCLDRTGGLLVLDDSFSKKREKIAEGSVEETGGTFQGSLRQVFVADPETKELDMAFNAQLRVLTSREYKVSGAIGLCTSREEKSHVVADTETGVGGTASWGLGAIDPNTSIGLYFEVASNAQDQQVGTTNTARWPFDRLLCSPQRSNNATAICSSSPLTNIRPVAFTNE